MRITGRSRCAQRANSSGRRQHCHAFVTRGRYRPGIESTAGKAMRNRVVPLAFATALALAGAAAGSHAATALLETPNIASPGDADDPAFWLHPTDASKSYVIGTAKNSGLRVYDLAGNELQAYLSPGKIDNVASRLNNVDVQYDFRLNDGTRADLAIFTDRGQDTLRVFRINASGNPLTEITGYNRLFPAQPLANQATGYGLALWRDAASDKLYSLVAQRGGSGAGGAVKGHQIAQFEMVAQAGGTVTSQFVRSWALPTTYKGVDLTSALTPSGDSYSPQSEGMVVDQRDGVLFVGQEDVGIWRIDLRTGTLGSSPLVETQYFDPTSPLAADVEGLTIRYSSNGKAVVLASSQGDSTFAAFDRSSFAYLGSFSVSDGTVDGVQHSDGADVTSYALPGYAGGLFVTQDGENTNGGGIVGTNFKYLRWSDIAADKAWLAPYAQVDPSFDPRQIAAVPEPAAWLLMALGLAGVLPRLRRGDAPGA